jgi:hypothetical protein
MVTQYLVFKIIIKSISLNVKNSNESIPIILNFLLKRSEENENYELSEIMKDIKVNYDKLIEMNNASVKQVKPVKKPIVLNKPNQTND